MKLNKPKTTEISKHLPKLKKILVCVDCFACRQFSRYFEGLGKHQLPFFEQQIPTGEPQTRKTELCWMLLNLRRVEKGR